MWVGVVWACIVIFVWLWGKICVWEWCCEVVGSCEVQLSCEVRCSTSSQPDKNTCVCVCVGAGADWDGVDDVERVGRPLEHVEERPVHRRWDRRHGGHFHNTLQETSENVSRTQSQLTLYSADTIRWAKITLFFQQNNTWLSLLLSVQSWHVEQSVSIC